ncbi:hypothetical protein [Oceaniglobus indicus]|uniref:hypothetical protein n=1 Tax=Oceaniglobus indicus TaxID=2047749 RepID=UPI000C19D43A|nr:hypothetical protein [Oceaniglobus indicus]
MRPFLPLLAVLTLAATTSQAACFADYKAKRDNPLKLHYGVVELPDTACVSRASAADAIARRIAPDGWQLLTVMQIFDRSGLDQRKASAGAYFLRY